MSAWRRTDIDRFLAARGRRDPREPVPATRSVGARRLQRVLGRGRSTTTSSTRAISRSRGRSGRTSSSSIDGWYPAQVGPTGCSSTGSAPCDYAYIPRTGTTVAYYNARLRARAAARGVSSPGWTASRPRGGLAGADRAGRGRASAARSGTRRPAPSETRPSAPSSTRRTATRSRSSRASPRPRRRAPRCDYLAKHDCAAVRGDDRRQRRLGRLAVGRSGEPARVPLHRVLRGARALRGRVDVSALEPDPPRVGIHARARAADDDVGDDRRRRRGPDAGGRGRPVLGHGWSSGAAPALTSEVLGVTPAAPGLRRPSALGRTRPALSGREATCRRRTERSTSRGLARAHVHGSSRLARRPQPRVAAARAEPVERLRLAPALDAVGDVLARAPGRA